MSTLRPGDLNRPDDAIRPGHRGRASGPISDLGFTDLQAVMKAAGEATRLRILALLARPN